MEGHEEVRRWLWGPSLTSTKVGLAAKCNCNDRPVLWITAVEDLGDSYPFVRVNLLAWVFPPALSVVASDKGKMSFSNDPFGHWLSLWANPLDVWQKYVYESSVINCKFLIVLSFRILFQYFEICISSSSLCPARLPRLSAITCLRGGHHVAAMLSTAGCDRSLGGAGRIRTNLYPVGNLRDNNLSHWYR